MAPAREKQGQEGQLRRWLVLVRGELTRHGVAGTKTTSRHAGLRLLGEQTGEDCERGGKVSGCVAGRVGRTTHARRCQRACRASWRCRRSWDPSSTLMEARKGERGRGTPERERGGRRDDSRGRERVSERCRRNESLKHHSRLNSVNCSSPRNLRNSLREQVPQVERAAVIPIMSMIRMAGGEP